MFDSIDPFKRNGMYEFLVDRNDVTICDNPYNEY